jgi:hypothetical protein
MDFRALSSLGYFPVAEASQAEARAEDSSEQQASFFF